MMEAASTSDTSVNFYQETRRYNPEDNHLHPQQHLNCVISSTTAPAHFETLRFSSPVLPKQYNIACHKGCTYSTDPENEGARKSIQWSMLVTSENINIIKKT
jgi:hypothetical protein